MNNKKKANTLTNLEEEEACMFAYRQTSSFNTKFCNKLFLPKKENRLNFSINVG